MSIPNKSPSNHDGNAVHPTYLTQKELASRWRLSECSIKNMRTENHLPYFCPPGATRFLYPVDAIEAIEHHGINNIQEDLQAGPSKAEIKVDMPVISTTDDKEWRI